MKKEVLVVDDEKTIVSMLEDVMGMAGFECVGFSRGEEALEEFKKDPFRFKVVITDLTMPGLKGDELAKSVKSLNPECLVILSTGYQPDLDAASADLVILQKPYHIGALLKLVRESFNSLEA